MRLAWCSLMTEVKENIAPKNGSYPQINLNTGVSVATLAMFIPLVVWTVGIKSDVGYHADRLTIAEKAIEGLRASIDGVRLGQAQADTKLEGRLVSIEVLLREISARLAVAERDRKTLP